MIYLERLMEKAPGWAIGIVVGFVGTLDLLMIIEQMFK